jgi:hypothetical protein
MSPQDIFNAIVRDFEGAWDAIAANAKTKGRGNFMFGKQAMTLLEFGSRLANGDQTGAALRAFSNELFSIEPKYATKVPSIIRKGSGFTLPYQNSDAGNELLWALFDVVRNGLAHQYQQITIPLIDGKFWAVMLTGPSFGNYLNAKNRVGHLSYFRDVAGDVILRVYPNMLFQDVQTAIVKSNLLGRGLNFDYLTRPGFGANYPFDSASLETSLKGGGHPLLP